ncbi:hypothetical protein D9M72_320100 [compost metagenome]
MGKGNEDTFGLFPDDVHLLHTRDVQKALPQRFGVADQHPLWLAFRLQRKQGEGHVRILVVYDRADHAGRQATRLVPEFLARLIELFLDLRRRCAIEQGHCGERQARSRVGFRAVIPAQFLHALLQPFHHLVLHLLRRRSRPGRDDGHGFHREGGIFRPAQLEEGDNACQRHQDDQEQRDRPFTDSECRKIEPTHCCTP